MPSSTVRAAHMIKLYLECRTRGRADASPTQTSSLHEDASVAMNNMRHITTDVPWCVGLMDTSVSAAKTAELIKMPTVV